MSDRVRPFLAVLWLIALVAGCSRQVEAPGPLVMSPEEYEQWEITLVEMRIEKNEDFADSTTTPLAADRLAAFEYLNYYFPDRDLRFRTPLQRDAGADTVSLTKRKGQRVPYLKRGTVAFSHDGRVHTLTVFGPADTTGGDYLWLPFYDETNGRETYGGGRYLDITVDADGLVDLDFNYAYNPLCEYNPERYNCTLPPRENTLPFAVEAGEKMFSTDH